MPPYLKHIDINSPNLCHQVGTLHRSYIETVLDTPRRIFPGDPGKRSDPHCDLDLAFTAARKGQVYASNSSMEGTLTHLSTLHP